jgi:hypothetical protein
MDMLIPDWSEHDAENRYEVRTSLVTSANVRQSMSMALDAAYRRTPGSRPTQTRRNAPRVAAR